MSLIPQFKIELQYIPTVKACLKLSQVDCFCLRLKGSHTWHIPQQMSIPPLDPGSRSHCNRTRRKIDYQGSHSKKI